jgi:hypothetical protein
VGDVAYRLHLPEGGKLHDVFQVGLLKQFNGEPPAVVVALPPICHGWACLEPVTVTKSRFAQGKHELLVNWKGMAIADASWLDLEEFRRLCCLPTRGQADCLEGERCHMGHEVRMTPQEHREGRSGNRSDAGYE